MGYMGAKSGAGVFQTIIALMRPHDAYVELFAGSAAIAQRKAPAAYTLLVEKDPRVARQLVQVFAGTPGVVVGATDAFEVLKTLEPRKLGRVLVYADPPYVLATRSSSKRYRHDFCDADHRRLAAELQRVADLGCDVIISGYPSDLYDEIFARWRTHEFQTMTRGGVRTEKLWFNFEPDAVHWASFAGRDRTDRQRIKRKAARWAGKFRLLPPAERQAVLAALLDEIPAQLKATAPPASTVDANRLRVIATRAGPCRRFRLRRPL